jgi:hypothetical protein
MVTELDCTKEDDGETFTVGPGSPAKPWHAIINTCGKVYEWRVLERLILSSRKYASGDADSLEAAKVAAESALKRAWFDTIVEDLQFAPAKDEYLYGFEE